MKMRGDEMRKGHKMIFSYGHFEHKKAMADKDFAK